MALRGKKEEEWWQELKLEEWRRVRPEGPCASQQGCKCYLGDRGLWEEARKLLLLALFFFF